MESVNIVDATETSGAKVKDTTPTGAEQALCVRTVGPVEVDGVVLANIQGVAKGSTPAASVTATDVDADHTALDVHVVAGTFPLTLDPTNLALDATLTAGSLKARVHGVAKGGTAAADATVSAVDANHDALDVYIRGTVAGGGGLTDAELRASPVPVSGPLTDAQLRAVAVPVSAASLPLPTGAATEATLAAALTTAAFQARINTQGQKAMAASTPVVIASDQSAVPVSGPLTDAQLRASAVPVSAAALPLPTGAATEATLAGVLTTAAFQARINTQGQKAMTASTPVVIASDQSAVPVSGPLTDAQLRASAVPISAAALPLPTGAATDAGLSAIFTELADKLDEATFTARIPTIGQKTKAGSVAVTLASDEDTHAVTVAAELPAGTQEIGSVAQGTAAENRPENAWPVSLSRDAYGADLMSQAVSLLQSLVVAQRQTNVLLLRLCNDSGIDISTDDLDASNPLFADEVN